MATRHDSDEAEKETTSIPLYRRQMSMEANAFIDEHFKPVFDKVKSQSGRDAIPLKLFKKELKRSALKKMLKNNPPGDLLNLLHQADLDGNEEISFEEFKTLLTKPKNLNGSQAKLLVRLLRTTLATMSAKEDNEPFMILKESPSEIFCKFPPPGFFLLLIALQLLIHVYLSRQSESLSDLLADSLLVYNPRKKSQLWRLFTYALVHRSYLHLIPNLLLQLIYGCSFELLGPPKSIYMIVIFTCGVLTGALGVNLIDPKMNLLGSSGGVYAILAAYSIYFILNYREFSYKRIDIVIILVTWTAIVGLNFMEYVTNASKELIIGKIFCHFIAALTGLLLGLVLFQPNRGALFKCALGTYLTMITILAAVYFLNYQIKRIELEDYGHDLKRRRDLTSVID